MQSHMDSMEAPLIAYGINIGMSTQKLPNISESIGPDFSVSNSTLRYHRLRIRKGQLRNKEYPFNVLVHHIYESKI